jgi:8-oxo-dGTP diphosphatase
MKVACAVIRNEENEVLVVQRGENSDHPYKWEFPGGKIEEGEREEECIVREIHEELSMEIVIRGRLPGVDHDYGSKRVLLIPFICDTLDELPLLAEHVSFRWVPPGELVNIDFSGADISVAANYLEKTSLLPARHHDEPQPAGGNNDEDDFKNMVISIRGANEASWIASSAIDNPAIFTKLIDFSFSRDKRLAFHSSWIVSKACDTFPELIFSHLPSIIDSLSELDNESALRSFLRIISLIDINRLSNKHHGPLANYCFEALRSRFSATAIKAYSMEILFKLAVIYPGMVNELSTTIKMISGDGSPGGITSRGRMILKKLAAVPRSAG